MSNYELIYDPTPDPGTEDGRQVAFEQWVASRPLSVQALITEFPPNTLYELFDPLFGNRPVTVVSYGEDDTIGVADVNQTYEEAAENLFHVAASRLRQCPILKGSDD